MLARVMKVAVLAAGTLAFTTAISNNAQADWLDDFFGPSTGGSSYGSSSSGGAYTVGFSKEYSPGQIIVSFGDRRLYYIQSKGQAISYPIAIPKGEARWSGVSRVSAKKVNPSWTPTASMRRENPKLPAFVPGGDPRNPLGVRALYLGSSLYRIHGTDAPWLIGQEVSKGCIRMHNSDVIDLYNRTRVGAKVIVTWKRYRTL